MKVSQSSTVGAVRGSGERCIPGGERGEGRGGGTRQQPQHRPQPHQHAAHRHTQPASAARHGGGARTLDAERGGVKLHLAAVLVVVAVEGDLARVGQDGDEGRRVQRQRERLERERR